MPPVVATLRPYEDAKANGWTDFPSGTTAWDHLNKTTAQPTAPSTTEGVKTKGAEKTASVRVRKNGTETFTLPAGATLNAIRVWAYLKSGSATEAKAFAFTAGSAVALVTALNAGITVTNTAYEWKKLEATTGLLSAKEELEKGAFISVTVKSKTAPTVEHEAVEIYVEVEYETAGQTGTASDTIAVSDSVATTVSRPRATADAISVAEAASTSGGRPRAVSDAISVSEAASAQKSTLRLVADAISVSEVASRAPLGFSRTATDTISVSESASRRETAARTASDTVSLSTGVTFTTGHTGAVLEAVITISSRKQTIITPTSRRQVDITVSSRRQTVITPTSRRQVDITISSRRRVDIQIKGVR